MENKQIRMRCIEALSSMGVRETRRIIVEAEQLEEWVLAAEPDDVPDDVETPMAADKEDKAPTPTDKQKAGKARRPR